MSDEKTSKTKIKSFVSEAKKKCKNRLYYDKYFQLENFTSSGLIQDENKAYLDRVSLDKSRNEAVYLFGFDENGSYFELSLSILSLYPDVVKPTKEGKFRVGHVDFTYVSTQDNCRYSYKHEQLIDYEKKEKHQHDSKNIYKIGQMSLEVVAPFALNRILFNGFLNRQQPDKEDKLVSIKLTISTHPTCDKFDYKNKFDVKYTSQILGKESSSQDIKHDVKKLLKLVLEDRIDQSMMFQGQFDYLTPDDAPENSASSSNFVMWGAKVKRFIDPRKEVLSYSLSENETREDLFVVAETGSRVHLTRPINNKNLVYGMVDCVYEYPSYLYECKLSRNVNNEFVDSFKQLPSFSDLLEGDKISVRAFKRKELEIEIKGKTSNQRVFNVTINGYKGFAVTSTSDLSNKLKRAQSLLWTLSLHDKQFGFHLATEDLLGGKGDSLVHLSRFAERLPSTTSTKVSVPKGLVVSTVAYLMWLNSEPAIMEAIIKLDNVRKSLAAQSIYMNPFSDKHLSFHKFRQILADQCKTTRQVLNSCQLPVSLVEHLKSSLESIFGKSVDEMPFAVRSSAVGEDSLETSAAGQMKTLLGVKGRDAICSAVVDCWSSQFELEPVMYKSQNGLELNLPMAVVVQELVDCKVAGVAATCNPLTGNKETIQILANPGLGEGVVSGKQTDTVDVVLKKLISNESSNTQEFIKKTSGSESGGECCLNDAEIISLANLLLSIRDSFEIKDREIEWAIQEDSSQSSFQIHLLQSRPLTHLTRLSSREVEHELDYGYGSPLEIVSRANLGEVMPGTLCPLFLSYFLPFVDNCTKAEKPYERNHTNKAFVAKSFAFYGQLATMVLSHNDVLMRFKDAREEDQQVQEGFRMMIGFTDNSENKETVDKFFEERMNPLATLPKKNLASIVALDFGGLKLLDLAAKESAKRDILAEDLSNLEELFEQIKNISFSKSQDKITKKIKRDMEKLYSRLTTNMGSVSQAWNNHIRATLLNIALNISCMRILSNQSNSKCSMNSTELVENFTLLMRSGSAKTESCDISTLLNKLIDNLANENQIEKAKSMNHKELYDYLNGNASASSVKQFKDFISKNGHRCYKEFDFSAITWEEDPSFIIKSLATRLKFYNDTEREKQTEEAKMKELKQEEKVEEILAKVEKYSRAVLTGCLLPRARNAVVRREHTKSHLIKTIDRYRRAFRHLAALLCLLGRLPSADLVYQLTLEELDFVVKMDEKNRPDLARILYKARVRKQRGRILDQITFTRPIMTFKEMVDLVRLVSESGGQQRAQNEPQAISSADCPANSVSGMTSCGGFVTGRACVVDTIEDMDQVEPNDILITYSIDISWSVYFFTLAGIVTEVGGIVSHGAVIAREQNVPTIVNAFGARSIFKTGQIVTLDANRGLCYLASSSQNSNQANGTLEEPATQATSSPQA